MAKVPMTLRIDLNIRRTLRETAVSETRSETAIVELALKAYFRANPILDQD